MNAGDVETHACQAVGIDAELVDDAGTGIDKGLGLEGVQSGHFSLRSTIALRAIFKGFHVKLLASRKEPIVRLF